jgi:hypothetical protein
MCSKEHSHPQWETKACLFNEATKALMGSISMKWKICASIMEFGKRSNNVHFVSKHVSRNGFCVHTSSLVFGLDWGLHDNMRQLPFCGIELIVFQLGFAQGYKLCNKKCKKMKQTWKKTTHITKMFPKLWSFLHNHRKLHPCLLWPWLWKVNLNLVGELQWDLHDY